MDGCIDEVLGSIPSLVDAQGESDKGDCGLVLQLKVDIGMDEQLKFKIRAGLLPH